ncbi:MAG: DNA replication/repair protein RecF [Ignavibacteriales bacterium]|nr:DNA replication/repair protein RecF [Ignavibacteriales bacterium]
MKLARVEIRNFRNHGYTVLEAAEGVNAILGNNGAGKTNIIEAVSYLCLTKSFYASGDAVVLQVGKDEFEIQGQFVGDKHFRWSINARYETTAGRKSVTINSSPVETLASVIGQFPVVVLSPEQSGITFRAPTERRKFLDLVISQSSRLYLEQLLDFRRVLRQRNRVLLQARLARRDCSGALEPWDESLLQTGPSLVHRRNKFIQEFLPYFVSTYGQLAGDREKPTIAYVPSIPGSDLEDIESIRERFRLELGLHGEEERRMGTTVVGPHRDELEFQVNELNLRKFASQGQHKTFLIALKLAEFAYLRECCQETPILLLDDIFSELDEGRTRRLLELMEPLGQIFITATDERIFPQGFDWSGKNRRIFVKQGEVVDAERAVYAE